MDVSPRGTRGSTSHKYTEGRAGVISSAALLAAWMDSIVVLSPLQIKSRIDHLAAFLGAVHDALQKKLLEEKDGNT